MISALAFENVLATMPVVRSDIKILILDDSQFDRTRIRRMFESIGFAFNLSEVESLDALSSKLDSQDFDFVLIDYHLPQGNGFEALARVQKHPRNGQATTVMIAGDDQSDIAVTALKSGCHDYVAKGALTAHRLRNLVLSAIEDSDGTKSETRSVHKQLEDLASRIKMHHSSALQPTVAKIIHDIRSLRTRVSHPQSTLALELASVEKRCLALWSSLTDAEKLVLGKTDTKRMN